MVHPPINLLGDFVPIHILANLKTNAPKNSSELSVSRELRRGHYDPEKCAFELADPIPDCCQTKQCPRSMKNPTFYKRKSRRYYSNKKEIKYDYFHGRAVLSCNMQIKFNDHCCLYKHSCFKKPYTGFVYFKKVETETETVPHENYWSTTSKRKRTKEVSDEYDRSTTLKRKHTKKTPAKTRKTKVTKKKKRENKPKP